MFYTFKKEERLKNRKKFILLFKKGKVIKKSIYSCRYLECDEQVSQVGFVVTKKICNSVQRNYEKRIMREFYRQGKDKLKKNYFLIFFLKQRDNNFLNKKNEFYDILSIIN